MGESSMFGLTRQEMTAVTDVFRIFEVGLRAGAIHTKVGNLEADS